VRCCGRVVLGNNENVVCVRVVVVVEFLLLLLESPHCYVKKHSFSSIFLLFNNKNN
jgi:uncharacterized membrane protein